MDNNTNQSEAVYKSGMIHNVISNSYITFLFAIVMGAVFDSFISFRIFNNYLFQYIGLILIFVGPALTYWAQESSRIAKSNVLKKGIAISFEHGPYKYTRNPSYLGVFIMVIGLGIILNSIFSVIFGIISYFLVRFIFIKKEEKLLTLKYGQVYLDYKGKVKNCL